MKKAIIEASFGTSYTNELDNSVLALQKRFKEYFADYDVFTVITSGMVRSALAKKEIMPRAAGDRPDVVPKKAVNFAFLGQFAETKRDTIFTTEYSMRTGMEAVYTLLDIDRGVPEVWGSVYDVRDLLNATVQLRDGKKITEMNPTFLEKIAFKAVLKKIKGTDIEKLLKEYNVI